MLSLHWHPASISGVNLRTKIVFTLGAPVRKLSVLPIRYFIEPICMREALSDKFCICVNIYVYVFVPVFVLHHCFTTSVDVLMSP